MCKHFNPGDMTACIFTVKDVVNLLRCAKELYINWDGVLKQLDTESGLEMAAYGDFVVNKVQQAYSANCFEIVIKATPLKMEA